MSPSKPLLDQTIDRFWETVPPLWGMIRAHIRATATSQFDISVEQFHVLRYVRRGKESMSELATAKNISRPAISQTVDVLVKKGYLTRTRSPRDRRYVDVALTEAGNQLLDAVFKGTRAWMKVRMKSLNAEELETISRAMEALRRTME